MSKFKFERIGQLFPAGEHARRNVVFAATAAGVLATAGFFGGRRLAAHRAEQAIDPGTRLDQLHAASMISEPADVKAGVANGAAEGRAAAETSEGNEVGTSAQQDIFQPVSPASNPETPPTAP